jgi:NADH-quinone oxidoreductase subunit M
VSGLVWGPLAAVGVILAAVYLLWMFQRVMYGTVREAYKALPDLTPVEVVSAAPLLALTVLFGVLPQPFIDIIEPSLERMLALAAEAAVAVR